MDLLGMLVAAGVSVLAGWVAIRLGPWLGLVDRPDQSGLKPHQGEVVPLGGLAVLIGVHLGLVVASGLDRALLAATVLVFAVGLVDDVVGLTPVTRLVGAIVAGLLLAGLGGTWSVWEGIAAPLLVVVLVNAVNLLDGLDLLAGSVTAIAAVAIAVLGSTLGSGTGTAMAILAAAILGFLVWNRPPARLFLGDNGAYVIGVTLVWGILGTDRGWAVRAAALALVGVPLLELGVTVVRRSRVGSGWFVGDRDHTYDVFHASGATVAKVAMVFTLFQLAWGGALLVLALGTDAATATVIAIAAGLVLVLFFGFRGRRPA